MAIYKVMLTDGPLMGSYASLPSRPLDGEEHLFSDKPIDERISPPFHKAHHYVFSEYKKCFVYLKSDIRAEDSQLGSELPETD